MTIRFFNAVIHTLDDVGTIKRGEIITKDGLISYVGPIKKHAEAFDRELDCGGDIIMPSLVNAHAHSAMTLFRGVSEGLSLNDWLFKRIFPLEKRLVEEDVYWGTMLALAEYVKNGITSFADMYYFDGGIAAAASRAGLRCVVVTGGSDLYEKPEKVLEQVEQIYLRYNIKNGTSAGTNDGAKNAKGADTKSNVANKGGAKSAGANGTAAGTAAAAATVAAKSVASKNTAAKSSGLLSCIMGCHAEYTCSETLLSGLVRLSYKYKAPLYTHISETLTEVGECTVRHKNLTPPMYLHSLGFFDNGATVAHGVFVDKDDIALMAQSGVSVVTCPSSNLKLGSGIAPVYNMIKNGLNVAIGTDGAASNNSLDMFKEMFLTASLQKSLMSDAAVLSAGEVLKMATINGSRALRLKNTGVLRVGYAADLILIDASKPQMQPDCGNINHLVYSCGGDCVRLTMCGGKIVYENGNYFIGEDIGEIYKKCAVSLKRLERLAK
jgi:5-methylthioadenosine/S-adenosylhomocysteine deaminase